MSQDLSQQKGEQIDRQSNREIFTFIFRNECIFHLLQKLACPSIYRSSGVVVRPFFPCVCSYFRICSHFGFFTLHHGNFSIDTVCFSHGVFYILGICCTLIILLFLLFESWQMLINDYFSVVFSHFVIYCRRVLIFQYIVETVKRDSILLFGEIYCTKIMNKLKIAYAPCFPPFHSA